MCLYRSKGFFHELILPSYCIIILYCTCIKKKRFFFDSKEWFQLREKKKTFFKLLSRPPFKVYMRIFVHTRKYNFYTSAPNKTLSRDIFTKRKALKSLKRKTSKYFFIALFRRVTHINYCPICNDYVSFTVLLKL